MSSSIDIDDEVFAKLKEEAEPFVDTPNSVLRRLLGLNAGAETTNGQSKGSTEVVGRTRKSQSSRAGRKRVPRASLGTTLPDASTRSRSLRFSATAAVELPRAR